MDLQIPEFKRISPVARMREQTPYQEDAQEIAPPLSYLKTKLLVPPPPPTIVPRLHLLERLNTGVRNKLLLISAAAGSGKTTLLSAWAAQSSWPIAWVSLDRNDNDPITFWGYVIAALKMASPAISEDIFALLYARQQLPIEAILTVLINTLVDTSQDLVLIFDDYHVIDPLDTKQAHPIHQTVIFLLDHLPANLHIIIASRVDPPLPLARLRANRQLLELHSHDLFFTAQETKTFFIKMINIELDDHLIAVLDARNEGWIAGLQLIALSLQICADIPTFIMQFTGNHRYILNYLADEVLRQQPAHVQTFLLHTSILDRLHGPLCDALTQQCNGQEMLQYLERVNLFLLPLDNCQSWYRYHHLFGDFLRERLKMVQANYLPILHQRASRWYEQNHFMFNAIDHALAIPDLLQAVDMIISIADEVMRHNETVIVQQWLNMLPHDLLHSQPELCLLQAWIYITSGQFANANSWLQKAAEELKNDASEATKEFMRHDPEQPSMRRNLFGKVFALQAHIAAFEGNVSSTIELANQALANLSPGNLFLRGLSILNLGFGYWLSGYVNEASQAFTEAIQLGETTTNNYIQLIALCGLSHVQIVQGRRHQAFTTSQRALSLVAVRKTELLSVASYAYVGMGHVLYEWNKLDEAERNLEEGVALSEQWGNSDMFIYGYTALAQVKQARGDTAQAYEILQRAKHYANIHVQSSWMTIIMVAQQIRLALTQGHMEIVDHWVQQSATVYVGAFEQITLVRIYIVKGQCVQALEILEQRLQQAKALQQTGSVIEISLLQALAYQKQDDLPNAFIALASALMLAEPEGYIRLFIDEGEPMERLLSKLLSCQQHKTPPPLSPTSRNHVKKLLAIFKGQTEDTLKGDGDGTGTKNPKPLKTVLTTRESKIVTLIIRGMSSSQIAQELFISENTVKWYVKQIYSKFHVHNRTQLLMHIKDLDLDTTGEE